MLVGAAMPSRGEPRDRFTSLCFTLTNIAPSHSQRHIPYAKMTFAHSRVNLATDEHAAQSTTSCLDHTHTTRLHRRLQRCFHTWWGVRPVLPPSAGVFLLLRRPYYSTTSLRSMWSLSDATRGPRDLCSRYSCTVSGELGLPSSIVTHCLFSPPLQWHRWSAASLRPDVIHWTGCCICMKGRVAGSIISSLERPSALLFVWIVRFTNFGRPLMVFVHCRSSLSPALCSRASGSTTIYDPAITMLRTEVPCGSCY